MNRRRLLIALAALVLTPVILAGVLALVVRTEWAERSLEKMVSGRLDREVQIEGIALRWGWPPGIVFARLRIANPQWAQTPNLIDAEGLYARVRVAPLLRGLIVVPYLGAARAQAGLEMDGERATWRFGERSDEPSKLLLMRIYLDDGHIRFIDAPQKTDLEVDVKGSAGEGGELRAEAKGRFRGDVLKASARIPELAAQHEAPVRFQGEASVGKTTAAAEGMLATDGSALDMKLKLAGSSLKELSKVTGIVLPDSPPYNIAGHLKHEGNDWHFTGFKGKVGDSDLAGNVVYTKVKPRPLFKADLRSNLLDLDDLGPLIGAPPKTGAGETASAEQKAKTAQRQVSQRILPDTEFRTQAWTKMDADVKLVAKRVQRPKQLPLDALQTHLVLRDGMLRLQPLNFTMAQGRITADITLDPHEQPMRAAMKVDVQGLQLKSLFPAAKSMEDALGTLYGRADLVGRGKSVAAMLGTSDGKAYFAVDGGNISALLGQLLELDIAHVVMLLGARHKKAELRCAVSGFQVKDGVAHSEDFVVDTSDTLIKVEGDIDLSREHMALETKPKPKDVTLVSLRTPIVMEGPLRKPKVRAKKGPIAARVAAGAALAAAAPPLAALALVDVGGGKDANCEELLAKARAHGAVKKTDKPVAPRKRTETAAGEGEVKPAG